MIDDKYFKPLEKMLIDSKDCSDILSFFDNFEIPIPEDLQKSIDAFYEDPSIENQDLVRVSLCSAIINGDSEILSDSMFDKNKQNSNKILALNKFYKQLEEAIEE